jgi:hypothetical protein
MAANKLIQQPDILSLDTLGSFMDAQNDPIAPAVEEKVVTKAEESASEVDSEDVVQNVVQEESSEVAQVDTTPQRPKVARARRGKQSNVQPVIEAGSGEWDMMVRYAEFYNDNPDEDRITVVLNPDIKRALDIIRINCRQFNFGNILNAVCRTFIERNKEQIQRMLKEKGGIL